MGNIGYIFIVKNNKRRDIVEGAMMLPYTEGYEEDNEEGQKIAVRHPFIKFFKLINEREPTEEEIENFISDYDCGIYHDDNWDWFFIRPGDWIEQDGIFNMEIM